MTDIKTDNSFLRRFRLNALSYGYGNVVTLLLQFVLVPVYLKLWGANLYADWIVLTGIPSMLTLLDIGVAQASNNKATMAAGADDWPSIRKIMHTSMAFTLILGVILIIGTIAATQLINWQELLKLKSITSSDASQILIIMTVYLGLQLLGGPIEGSFKVSDRTAIGAFLIANRRMVDFVASILVLASSGTPVNLATCLLIGQFIMFLLLLYLSKRLAPQPVLGVRQASWQEFCSILKPAIAYASFPVTQTVTIQGGIQLLNQLVDASTLVGFTMARTLMRLIIQLAVVANSALKPEISRLAGQGKWDLARKATLKMTKIISGLAGICYVSAIVLGPYIITWWGQGKIHVDRITLALVGVHAILNVGWFVPAALLIATNKHNRIASFYGISSIVAILLWIVFSRVTPPILGASMLLAGPELVILILFYMHQKQYATPHH